MELQTSWLARDITAPPPCALLYANGAIGASITADNMQHLGVLFTVDAAGVHTVSQAGDWWWWSSCFDSLTVCEGHVPGDL